MSVSVRKNPGCLIQLLWFVFIGWWVGQLWIAAAWVLVVSVIGFPLGLMMLNRVPQVIALRDPSAYVLKNSGGATVVTNAPQVNIILRIIYFVLIGWWLCGVWIQAAYFFCATIIGFPVGFWMFDRVPAIVSLRR